MKRNIIMLFLVVVLVSLLLFTACMPTKEEDVIEKLEDASYSVNIYEDSAKASIVVADVALALGETIDWLGIYKVIIAKKTTNEKVINVHIIHFDSNKGAKKFCKILEDNTDETIAQTGLFYKYSGEYVFISDDDDAYKEIFG